MCRPIIMLQVLQFRAEVTFGKERRKSYLTSKLRTSTSCIFVNYIYFVSFCISILAAYKFTTKNKSLVLFYQIKFISFKLSYNFKILMSCGFDSHDIVLTSTYVLFWIKFLINLKKYINVNIVQHHFLTPENMHWRNFLDRTYGFKLPQTTPLNILYEPTTVLSVMFGGKSN